MLLHSYKDKVQSTAVALAMLGVLCTPHSARAGVLDELGQTLLNQNALPGGVISENPSASPPQTQPTAAQATPTAVGASGVISETAQPPTVIQQAGGAIQNKADGVVDGALGGIGSTVGNILGGHHSGILGSILDPFEQQMGQYISAAQAYLHNAIGDFLGGLFGHSGTPATGAGAPGTTAPAGGIGVDTPPGAMGIPDPYAVKKSIEANANSGSNGNPSLEAQQADRFNVNPVVLTNSLAAEQDRTLNKTIAASVLSDAGQQAMTGERTAAAQTLQQIQAKAQEAQGMDVTQDVMKNLTAMVSGQSSLESGSYAQTMMIHQQLSATGIVASNISEALDETNRARHVEAMAGASGLLRSASSVYLPGS